MRNARLGQLVSSLLLAVMATTFQADAFSSIQQRKRSRVSCSRQCIQRTHLFGRRDDKFSEEDSDGFNSRKGNKRNGIIRKDVEKLHRPFNRKNYQTARLKKGNKYYKKKNQGRIRRSIISRWRRLKQKIGYPIFRNTVYVLKCENNKYYVGSTKNRKRRYRQHLSSRGGSKWTRTHKPIGVVDEYLRIPSRYVLGTESQVTAEYMYKYGVNNVRGASFCKAREFTKDDLENLTAFLGHYNQLSYPNLRKELSKVLPDASFSTRKAFAVPPRVFNTRKKSIDTNKSNPTSSSDTNKSKEDSTSSGDLPRAVVRAKMRKEKRRKNRKKKQRALARKKYIAENRKSTEDDDENLMYDEYEAMYGEDEEILMSGDGDF